SERLPVLGAWGREVGKTVELDLAFEVLARGRLGHDRVHPLPACPHRDVGVQVPRDTVVPHPIADVRGDGERAKLRLGWMRVAVPFAAPSVLEVGSVLLGACRGL